MIQEPGRGGEGRGGDPSADPKDVEDGCEDDSLEKGKATAQHEHEHGHGSLSSLSSLSLSHSLKIKLNEWSDVTVSSL